MNTTFTRRLLRAAGGLVPLSLLAAGGAAASSPPLAQAVRAAGDLVPLMSVGAVIHTQSPPSSAFCFNTFGIACYAPSDMAHEYNFSGAYVRGDTGAGQTIVIFDSYGSPTIRHDLATFDKAYGLKSPPSFHIYYPEGKPVLNYQGLPSPANYNNKAIATEVGWAYETTLDVEWAHAMAPGANIALVTVPVAETQGVQGLQNLENAQRWALMNHIGNIWSDSFATTEQAFHNPAVLMGLNNLYAQADAAGITPLFASGDSGVVNANLQGKTYPYPTVNFPSSSPNVLSVGGTQINASNPAAPITSYQPEAVWNDHYGAGGGGFSVVFGEPAFQSTARINDPSGMRGLPDVSYNAAVISAVNIYESFDPIYGPGWVPIGGTSAATPQWAAALAVINQADGAQGFIAPKLYGLSASAYASAFHDITVGNNSFGGITGYNAGPGWDPASGLGTPNVAGLVGALKTP